jgi:hypothetical protein
MLEAFGDIENAKKIIQNQNIGGSVVMKNLKRIHGNNVAKKK